MVTAYRHWMGFAARSWSKRRLSGKYAALDHLSRHDLDDLNLPPAMRAEIDAARSESRRRAIPPF